MLAAALGLTAGRANALPAIRWEAPAGCPEAQRVEARIREVVGARPVSPAVTAVHARVKRQGEGWLLAVVFTRDDGTTERRLTLHDCEATANATALLVGIALVEAPESKREAIPLAVPVPEAAERGPGATGAGAASGSSGAAARGEETMGAHGRSRAAGPGEGGEDGRGRASAGSEGEASGRERAATGSGGEANVRIRAATGEANGRTRAAAGSEGEANGRGRAAAGGEGETNARSRAASGETQAVGLDGARDAARGRPFGASGGARARAFAQVGPAVAAGIVPRVTPALTAALGVAWPRLRLALGYTRLFRSEARWSVERDIGAEVSVHAASLRAGPVRRVGPVELQAGLGLEFGAMRALGFGSPTNLDGRTWWGGALGGGALAWVPRALRGHGALVVQAELVVPLHRPTLLYNDDPIFRLGAVGLRAGVQLEARLF
ncbi:hypothetical protein [Nannocystis pusilla]|uniref:Uncharacterized protein n=1 Tax=Nannocystis pusilla TaxID=889268 RepID=A0ABS7TJP0_9BACT|nr:hypothetical protein [Nannocystis pusilla]MBZ5708441.1 hypothetical protein [Nannocystis pusilla]